MKIIAWGAGYTGKAVMSQYPEFTEQIVQIVDSDPLLWGRRLLGLDIQSPLSLDENADCVVITVRKKKCIESIKKYLELCEYKKKVLIIDDFLRNENIEKGDTSLFTFTNALSMPLDEIRTRLQDEVSRRLFESRLYAYSTWDVSVFIKTLINLDREDGTLPILESYHVKVEDDKLTWLKKQTLIEPKDRKPIILVGVNESQLQMLHNLGLDAKGFIDREDKKHQGSYGKNVPEFSIEECINLYPDAWFLSTYIGDEPIKKRIIEAGAMSNQFLKYHTCWRTQYFDEDFLAPDINGVFIDCGVYDLNNTLEYIDWCRGEYECVYAIEPDSRGYRRCLDRLSDLSMKDRARINLINAAVGQKDGTITFNAYEGKGYYQIPVCSIDKLLNGNRVTYIKMDIEGAELEALKGAAKSIQEWKPRLAICIYHKREDIYEIPLYILSLRPDYKLYIRQYASCSAETVLYCI